MILNIITRCSRINNLQFVKDSVYQESKFSIIWHVLFDTTIVKDIDAEILSEIQNKNGKVYFINSIPGDFGHQMINKALDNITHGFVFVLDDDNIIHEDFYDTLYKAIMDNPEKRGFIYHQRIDGKDFTGLEIRYSSPDKVRVSEIDMAQVVMDRSLISIYRFGSMNYVADSIYIEEIYNSNPSEFYFIDKILCYYNFLKKPRSSRMPKILYIGDGQPNLLSRKKASWESDQLDVSYVKNDENINIDIIEVNPDFIVSIGDISNYPNLSNSNLDIKKKWINLSSTIDELGEISYNSSMNYILERYNRETVSFFTPIYNTGDKLNRVYESLYNQTYNNWEWVIVNDSSDGGKTLKVAESIASKDPRVVVYDFRQKSNGVIGESKYRAAMLCKGGILIEVDHDDYLMPESAKTIISAFDKYPDAGFAYTDCVEITENWVTLKYPDGFCFGYGKYRIENELGIEMNVNESPNINPKTIRHIVGIPNHIRAWRRETYLKVGGHNRRLSVADDYDLVVRTFLETKFIKIVKNCYLQFIYNNENNSNTHELARADIQRRVRSISDFYNFKIKNRFNELGFDDWAYNENQSYPLLSQSRFGEEEGYVNYIYIPDNQ